MVRASAQRRVLRQVKAVLAAPIASETKRRGRPPKAQVGGEVGAFPAKAKAPVAEAAGIPVMTHHGKRLFEAFNRLPAKRRNALLAQIEAEAGMTK